MKLVLVLAPLLLLTCAPLPTVVAAEAQPAGAAVQLWQDASIFGAVHSVIHAAHRRIWVEMYEFGRNDIAQLLAARQREGLDVRVILDPSVGVSDILGASLRRSGVSVRFYPIDDRRHQIDHVKLLLTDTAAVVGGMNWGAHSNLNHDYALLLRPLGMLIRLAAIFEQDWALGGGVPAPLLPEFGPIAQTAPGAEIRQHLDRDIDNARHLIHVEIFVLTDIQVVGELINALRRGVDVEVMMDPNQVVNAAAHDLLSAAGVPVRWYPIPPGAKLHAKAGVFDDTLLVGSANWSLSGLSVNHELDVETREAAVVHAFASRFATDWAKAGAV